MLSFNSWHRKARELFEDTMKSIEACGQLDSTSAPTKSEIYKLWALEVAGARYEIDRGYKRLSNCDCRPRSEELNPHHNYSLIALNKYLDSAKAENTPIEWHWKLQQVAVAHGQ